MRQGKRLDKVETLFSNVIDRYATRTPNMLSLLDSAKESVVRAKAVMNQAALRKDTKPPEKAKAAKRRATANGNKKAAETGRVERKTA